MWRMMLIGLTAALLYLLVPLGGSSDGGHHEAPALVRPVSTLSSSETFGEPWDIASLGAELAVQGFDVSMREITWADESTDDLVHLSPPFVHALAQGNKADASLLIYPDRSSRLRDWVGEGASVRPTRFVVTDTYYYALDNVVVIESAWRPSDLGTVAASLERQ